MAVTRFLSAAIQYEPAMFEKDRNVEEQVALVEDAACAGAQLIVLPEMSQVGYSWLDRAEIRPYVEPVPGPTIERYADVAARCDCYIAIGLAEVDPETDVFYNTVALVGPAGYIGKYRKTHPFLAEPRWAADGDLGLPVFDTPIGRLGILNCQDAVYLETARLLAVQGAEVLLFPTNWCGEAAPAAVWVARAVENGVYLIAADRYGYERGTQFSGGSCVIGTDGRIIASRATGNGAVFGEIDRNLVRAKPGPRGVDALADRQPACYQPLLLNTYLWSGLESVDWHERPLPPGRRVTVAVAQIDRRDGGLTELEALTARAARGGAELLVAPHLGGIARDHLEQVPSLAQRHGLLVALGAAIGGQEIVCLVGPVGVLASRPPRHGPAALQGEWQFVDTPLGRVGLLTDVDLFFPESARCLAALGCDYLCVIGDGSLAPRMVAGSLEAEQRRSPRRFNLARQRADENDMYVLFANSGGEAGSGGSGIFGPGGEGVSTGEGSRGLAVLQTTTERWLPREDAIRRNPVRTKPNLARRRTDLYLPLVRATPSRAPHGEAVSIGKVIEHEGD